LPIENVKRFTENWSQLSSHPRPKWTHYHTKPGDSVVALAKKFDTTPEAIRKLNKLNTKKLKQSADLLIPARAAQHTPETKRTPTVATYVMQPGDTVYLVRAKDTLNSIADRFHVDPDLLRTANQNKILSTGKQWIIPTHELNRRAFGRKIMRPGDTVYMVRRGDTVESIARKFHVLPAEIRLANLMQNRSLNEGEHLMIPTHHTG
jgi:membrane-bound lytic murein transglycosylase D